MRFSQFDPLHGNTGSIVPCPLLAANHDDEHQMLGRDGKRADPAGRGPAGAAALQARFEEIRMRYPDVGRPRGDGLTQIVSALTAEIPT